MKTTIKNITLGLAVAGMAIFTSANAQSNKQVNQLEKQALKAFKSQNYDKALAIYTQLDNMSNDPIKYDYMIGMCYLSTDAKEKALAYFRTAKSHKTTSWVVNYYLGRAYMIEGNFIEAGNYLTIYKDSLSSLMSEVKVKFRVKPNEINEKNRIHMEKTPESVATLIAECDIFRKEQYDSFAKNDK